MDIYISACGEVSELHRTAGNRYCLYIFDILWGLARLHIAAKLFKLCVKIDNYSVLLLVFDSLIGSNHLYNGLGNGLELNGLGNILSLGCALRRNLNSGLFNPLGMCAVKLVVVVNL